MLELKNRHRSIEKRWKAGHWQAELIDDAHAHWVQKRDSKSLLLYISIRQVLAGFTKDTIVELFNETTELKDVLSGEASLFLWSLCNQHQIACPRDILKQTEKATDRCLQKHPSWFLQSQSTDHATASKQPKLASLANDLRSRMYDWEHYIADLPEGLIAVVGNGPYELGQAHGEEIDACAQVFRFNNATLNSSYVRDYGTRTDCWVVSPAYKPKHDKLIATQMLITGLSPWCRPGLYWQRFARLSDVRYFSFPATAWYQLVAELEAPPSAGLLTVYSLLNTLTERNSVKMFGINRDERQLGGNHYNDLSKRSSRHNWLAEATIVNNLIDNSGIAQAASQKSS